MNDLTASLLTLLLVSPSMAVLYVLVVRWAWDVWTACFLSARARWRETMPCQVRFQRKLCGEMS